MWSAWWSGPVFAFELRHTEDGDVVRWSALPVSYALADDEDEVQDAMRAAFSHWEGVDGADVAFVEEAPPDALAVAPDAVNVVYLDPSWPFGDSALAMTSAWSDRDGHLLAFDIQVNPTAAWSTDGDPAAYDLEAALTHEVGHALGIEHSPRPEATMFATQGPGEAWRRGLHPDDEAAAAFLYPAPADGPDATLSPTAATGDDDASAWPVSPVSCAHAPGGGLAVAALVPLLSRRRRAPEAP